MKTTRRKFLDFFLTGGILGSIAAVFYPVANYLVPPKQTEAEVNSIKVGKISEFKNNDYKIVKFGRKPAIIIKDDSGEFHALSATCTHLGCIVQYRKDTKQIWCACHNGIYSLKGRNISGPPPKPLKEFKVNFVNEEIVITKTS